MKNYSRSRSKKIFNTSLMNSDVTYSFKELMMGHSVKLDDIYYDKDNEKSQQKILLEYIGDRCSNTINDFVKISSITRDNGSI